MTTHKINFQDWKDSIQEEIAVANERMEKDFLNAFEWNYHEKRFEAEFKIRFLSYFKEDILLEQFVHEVEKEIFNRLPLQTSTSNGSNRAKVLELNALNYLRKNAGWYSIK